MSARIWGNFPKIYRAAKKIGTFEIIIAEDGSTDCSKEVSKGFAMLSGVKLMSRNVKLGRGTALKNAVRHARGDVIGYMDIDLAVPLTYLPVAVDKVEEGHKFVTGSRYRKGSRMNRSSVRLVSSVGYNLILKILFNSKVNDHQCGFKFWESAFIKKEIKEVKDDHWFFDSEMIIKAQREGTVPYEIPVEWKESKSTKVKASNILYFLKSAIAGKARIRMVLSWK